MLARRLLSVHPTIKLVLMSATLHTGLYTDYFNPCPVTQYAYLGDLECLSVGARRFPVEICYSDDVHVLMGYNHSDGKGRKGSKGGKQNKAGGHGHSNGHGNGRERLPVITTELKSAQYVQAEWIIRHLVLPGTG